MTRKTRKSKTERAQELQAAMETQAEANLEQEAANAEANEPEVEATEATVEAPEGEATEGEEEAPVPHSIVPRKYRTEYKARGHARRCGDDLSAKMESWVQDQDGNLLLDRLYAIGRANGVTKEWRHLNNGQQRMNLGNMLRRKLSEGDGILAIPAFGDQPEAKVAIEPYYSAAQKDAA